MRLAYTLTALKDTRPKPVEHMAMHVFSLAVSTIWEWLKLVSFFVKAHTVDSGGGGGGWGFDE